MAELKRVLVMLISLNDRILRPARPEQFGIFAGTFSLERWCHDRQVYLPTVGTLPAMLEEPIMQLSRLRIEQGYYPTQRTWARRAAGNPECISAQIACPGST